MGFFQSVQTELQLQNSVGHTEQMNSKCAETSLDKTLAGGKTKCKVGTWKSSMETNI